MKYFVFYLSRDLGDMQLIPAGVSVASARSYSDETEETLKKKKRLKRCFWRFQCLLFCPFFSLVSMTHNSLFIID